MKTDTVDNIYWHDISITKEDRALRYCQKPTLIWFTGLSGAGKSTIANALEKKLFSMGFNTYTLDGDNVRHGLCSDLGFSDNDRSENIRRVGEVAKLMLDAGFVVLASFISPFSKERTMVRNLLDENEFVEVYINTPLSVCEERDPKGLYKKARSGEIKDFTGIDSIYEPPESPECEINTQDICIETAVDALISELKSRNVIY